MIKRFFAARNLWTMALCLMVCSMAVFMAVDAMAITAPAAGSFAYDVYDVFVNQMLLGPIGFVGGAAAVTYGGLVTAQGNYPLGVPAILGGVIILKADAITQTLGMMV